MAKVYRSDNYIVIDDGINVKEIPAKDCSFSEKNSQYTIIDNIKGYETTALPFSNITNESGSPYSSESEFISFLRTSTGGNTFSDSEIKDYVVEVGLGKVNGVSLVNKFGYNLDVDTGSEEIIAEFGGSFDPLTDIMSTDQQFLISYNNTTDGLGTTGALSLIVTYIDENFAEQNAFHTLGNTGGDVTSFRGYGVNRVVVYSNGGYGSNENDITFAAAEDLTTQAVVPSEKSVTQQCIYHIPQGFTFLMDFTKMSVLKISGGGGNPEVEVRGYSYSRVTNTTYNIFDTSIDANRENNLPVTYPTPFVFTGREVVFFTAETDTSNTKVSFRFSGKLAAS